MNVLETKNLSFSYGEVPVLTDISFRLRQGSFAALIGPNGAGKSTLLKLLLGELTPTAGTTWLMGKERKDFRGWRSIGYVPQDGLARQKDFPASVREIVQANLCAEIGLGRLPRKKHREQTEWALELVGMQDYGKRLIGALSGGQRQRVLLARALVSMPDVMILDEPTSGMDQQSAEEFYQLLSRLNRNRGLTILMVSHDVERVCGYVSQFYCLDRHTMVEITPEQMQEEGRCRFLHLGMQERGGAVRGNF